MTALIITNTHADDALTNAASQLMMARMRVRFVCEENITSDDFTAADLIISAIEAMLPPAMHDALNQQIALGTVHLCPEDVTAYLNAQ